MQQAFQIANQHIEQTDLENKGRYDNKMKRVKIEAGDTVLVKNKKKEGQENWRPAGWKKIILWKNCLRKSQFLWWGLLMGSCQEHSQKYDPEG